MFTKILVAAAFLGCAGTAMAQSPVVFCRSLDADYTECPVPLNLSGVRVRLIENVGDRQCIRGQNWGVRNNAIWVRGGCGGRFALERMGSYPDYPDYPDYPYDPWNPYPDYNRIRCESWNYAQEVCGLPYGVFGGSVRLVRQLSTIPCVEGVTWGVTRNAVWVSGGCRAEFAFTSRGYW